MLPTGRLRGPAQSLKLLDAEAALLRAVRGEGYRLYIDLRIV